jgi:deazaflavin-dependent oxidoreductase (nitroreductase family)
MSDMAAMNDFNQQVIAEFRENGGVVGGPFQGAPMVLVHHKGAKSGTSRISPLVYQALDGGYAVFASKGGAPDNPDWYHNLLANPDTEIEVGDAVIAVTARVAEGDERERIWTKQKADFPNFAEYEASTSRTIPVVVLEPR